MVARTLLGYSGWLLGQFLVVVRVFWVVVRTLCKSVLGGC